jgi:hypothetical protein
MAKIHPKPLPNLTQSDVDRFLSKVNVEPGQGPTGQCFEWKGSIRKLQVVNGLLTGYGQFSVKRRNLTATRVAYFIATKEDAAPFEVLHTCDWPPCCNPEHFFKGTNQDNVNDRTIKGRGAIGERNGTHIYPERLARGRRNGAYTHPETVKRGDECAARKYPEKLKRGLDNFQGKFTDEQCEQMKVLRSEGHSYQSIANITGASKRQCMRIIKGESRRPLTE